ncbi:hypothetical protein [Qaidamihabitans albus]|uniref:hypothetical protein n=1 Tax=Qaidamihabitans albus TaxID=2795733 RepID=UPI0018F1EF18|nr:hypothetical protein [Qaidamihabitans albus]
MITPERALLAIRQELLARVLPAVTDQRARSSVVAAAGILGELVLQTREDDEWAARSAEQLETAVHRWREAGPEIVCTALDSPSGTAPATPSGRRVAALEAVERLVARLWQEPEPSMELLRDIRTVLRADLDEQLKRIR